MLARQRSGAVHSALARALPDQARRLVDREGGAVETVGLVELRAGDRVLVGVGEIVPADGTVIEGRGRVDESLVSGESAPRGGSRDARGSPADLCPHSRLGVDGGVEASCRHLQVRLPRLWGGIRHPQCALHACIGSACRPSGSAPQRGPRGEEHGVLSATSSPVWEGLSCPSPLSGVLAL